MRMRSTVTLVVLLLVTLGPNPGRLAADSDAANHASAKPAFFAFCFDTHDAAQRDLAAQATLLKRLGFDGAGHVGLEKMEERLRTLDDQQLKLFMAGFVVDVSQPYDETLAQLRRTLPLWRDRNVVLYVVLTGYPAQDPRGEEPGIAALRQIADLADPWGVTVGLYPHTGDWVTRVDHAVRVVEKVDRKNCGVVFNLCHWLRNDDGASLDQLLEVAGPHLVAVTINGADSQGRGDSDWQRLIQPLDRGDFDIAGLLAKLQALGYKGPVGLMCWGIQGDAEEHLRRSMAQWRKINP